MIEVVASGVFTSLQDMGRFGYRRSGVPVSGAMDQKSAIAANFILGNDPNDVLIEFTASGPVLRFNETAIIAITGGLFSPIINETKVAMNAAILAEKGSTLSFSQPGKGVRGYIAIAGGFISEEVLGSRSFYDGITVLTKLQKGVVLKFHTDLQPASIPIRKRTDIEFSPDFNIKILEVYKGPEFQTLSDDLQKLLMQSSFKIAPQSNRMAFVLHTTQDISASQIITSSVQPGTVQLTPAGDIHILMRDAQTTGGYARIFQLTDSAINILAQKRAGSRVHFKIVGLPFDIPA